MNKHPLDAVFDIAPNAVDEDIDIEAEYGEVEVSKNPVVPAASTAVSVPTEAPVDLKDEDDKLVEKRLDDIHDAAMKAFNDQTAFVEALDPRYAARNAEVAANFLNIALSAANSRAKQKVERKRANAPFIPYNNQGGGGTTKNTTNVVIASREDLLKMINVDSDKKTV